MKASRSLITHASVFAVGVAVAMVARQPDADPAAETSAASRNRTSSARAAQASEADAKSGPASTRGKTDADAKSGRAAGTPAEKLADVIRIGDPLDRQSALMDLINRLGPGEFATFADSYREMDHFGNARGEYELILRAWAKVDPLGALDHAAQRPDGFGDQTVLLTTWAGKDAAAAERWALDHHQGDGPNPYLASVIRGIAANDIARAGELAATMPLSRERGEAMDAITRALFVQGAEAAMAYPNTIQDPDMRAGYVSMIADRLARKDADTAATWLAAFSDPALQNRGARRVADALAQVDPGKAAAWVQKLSPAAQAEAARGVIQPMSSGDIAGTAKWVSTLSGIPNYDRVVEEFVWSCDQRAPEQSAAWIQGISDPAQQTRLYHRMLGEWARRDANAVKNWVANNNVPNSVAQRFR